MCHAALRPTACEVIHDALIEAVELRSALAGELGVGCDRREKTGGQRGVDALEKLEEDEMRIPTKPAMHSNMKPATYSDPKPARLPI